MPFWKKSFSKARGVYYPRAIVQGNPVETETIAKDLAKISTVSNSDVQAVLGDIAGVMHTRMAQGKSVHIKGLGYFRYVLDTTGVETSRSVPGPPAGRTPAPSWTATSWNGLNWLRTRRSRIRQKMTMKVRLKIRLGNV